MDRDKVISTLEDIKTQTAEIGLDSAVIAHKFIDKILALLKEQRTTVEVVAVTKENGSVNLFAFNESSDAIKCFCYWKDRGATVTCGEVDIQ